MMLQNVRWLSFSLIYMSFLNPLFFLKLLAGLDLAVKFTMDFLLTCNSKTWRQYCGGCISKLICVCLVYQMCYSFVFAVNVAITLFRICMMESKCKMCDQSCDQTNTLNISDSVALLRGSALFFRCAPGSLVMRRYQVRF